MSIISTQCEYKKLSDNGHPMHCNLKPDHGRYCDKHKEKLIGEMEYNECYICHNECNVCSQVCGRCARGGYGGDYSIK